MICLRSDCSSGALLDSPWCGPCRERMLQPEPPKRRRPPRPLWTDDDLDRLEARLKVSKKQFADTPLGDTFLMVWTK